MVTAAAAAEPSAAAAPQPPGATSTQARAGVATSVMKNKIRKKNKK